MRADSTVFLPPSHQIPANRNAAALRTCPCPSAATPDRARVVLCVCVRACVFMRLPFRLPLKYEAALTWKRSKAPCAAEMWKFLQKCWMLQCSNITSANPIRGWQRMRTAGENPERSGPWRRRRRRSLPARVIVKGAAVVGKILERKKKQKTVFPHAYKFSLEWGF